MRIAGIDGYTGGWIAVVIDDGNFATAQVFSNEDLETLIASNAIEYAIVDIPIGLTSDSEPRNTEAAMRNFLTGRTSCVFNTPCRQALDTIDAQDYWQASDVNHKILGKKLSKQTFYIMAKIRQADRVVQKLGQDKIREGHPEVSFKILANDKVLNLENKKTNGGKKQRIDFLEGAGFDCANLKQHLPNHHPAKLDDLLDAAVLAWSANRWKDKKLKHKSFPSTPKKDSKNLEMVVYA